MSSEEDSKIIKIYYKEAAQHPLLSREGEIELFMVMQKWSHNKSDCGSLARKKGIEARDTLIKSNLRLVIKIAKEFMRSGLDLADLINEGNGGLMRGVDKFLLGKGAKLSHYAGFWIRQGIMRALANQGRTIRLPQGAVQQKIKIIKFAQKFEQENNHRPSNAQIAKGLKLSLGRVVLLNESSLNVASLNAPIPNKKGDENFKELADSLPDEKFKLPDEIAMINNDNNILYNCLDKLDNREKYIITKRFALDCQKPETLEVIGEKFGVTRERIRQVESQAIRKLKFLLNRF
jgi:RNA polymerase primary sigma factor|tara:strand:+ start:867 stop:1739 length:873 start_codon:yes stop_codon:yes gene_type:complete